MIFKEVKIRQVPLRYQFIKNNYEFMCEVSWRDESGVHSVDALIADLQECIRQLNQTPRFKVEKPFELPPLKDE